MENLSYHEWIAIAAMGSLAAVVVMLLYCIYKAIRNKIQLLHNKYQAFIMKMTTKQLILALAYLFSICYISTLLINKFL